MEIGNIIPVQYYSRCNIVFQWTDPMYGVGLSVIVCRSSSSLDIHRGTMSGCPTSVYWKKHATQICYIVIIVYTTVYRRYACLSVCQEEGPTQVIIWPQFLSPYIMGPVWIWLFQQFCSHKTDLRLSSCAGVGKFPFILKFQMTVRIIYVMTMGNVLAIRSVISS